MIYFRGGWECLPKLLEANGPAFVGVEHPDHHLHRVRVKACVIAIHKCGTKLSFCKLTGASFVHGFEEGKE